MFIGSGDDSTFPYAVIGGAVGGFLILVIACLLITVICLLCKINRRRHQQNHNENYRTSGTKIPTQGFDNPTYGEQQSHTENDNENRRGSLGENRVQTTPQNIGLPDCMYATVNDGEHWSPQPSDDDALAHSYAYVMHDSFRRKPPIMPSAEYAEVCKPQPYKPRSHTLSDENPLAVRKRIPQPPDLEDGHYSHLQHVQKKTHNRHSMPLLSATGTEYSQLNIHREHDRRSQYCNVEPAATGVPNTWQNTHIYGVLEGPTPEEVPQGKKDVNGKDHLEELSEALYDRIPSASDGDPTSNNNMNPPGIYDDLEW